MYGILMQNWQKKYKGSYLDMRYSPNPFGSTNFTDVADFVFTDDVKLAGYAFW